MAAILNDRLGSRDPSWPEATERKAKLRESGDFDHYKRQITKPKPSMLL